jgi:hypothetical protein
MADEGGGLFGGLYERLSDPMSLTPGATGTYIIYALILGIIVATAVLVADAYYPFLPTAPTGPSAAARAGVTFWAPGGDDAAPQNLIVPVAQSPTTTSDSYSMNVQLMIGDSRTPDIGRFRHVLHRGSNPCNVPIPTRAGPSGHAGIRLSDLPSTTDAGYRDLGLPTLMSPGLFLDRYKNDLHVFMHTLGEESGSEVIWLESQTVEDLPLNTPLTIGIVCNGRQLELYVNCRLYSTTLLRGRPYLPAPSVNNVWYGRYCAFPFSGIVQNLTLWGTPIDSGDFVQMCRSPSINPDTLPAKCPTST